MAETQEIARTVYVVEWQNKGATETANVMEEVKTRTGDTITTTKRLGEEYKNVKGPITAVSKATTDHSLALRESEKSAKYNMQQLHSLNMAILGVNMSLLGITFNLRNMGLVSEQTGMELTMVISRIQLMLTFMGMAIALHQMWTVAAVGTQKAVASLSFWMLGIGLLMGFMGAHSTKLRILLGALTIAVFALAGAFTAAAISKVVLDTFMNPIAAISKTAIAGALVGAVLGMISIGVASTRGFAGKVFTGPTSAILGDSGAEVAVPLQSPRAARMMNMMGSGNGGINIQNVNVRADSPSVFYREMSTAVQHKRYTSGG